MEPKKYPSADVFNKKPIFLNLGLVVSLVIAITAFEWKFYDDGNLVDLGNVADDFEDLLEIPPTEQPPPPPPKIQQPEIIEIPDEEEIDEEIDIDLDVEITEETVIEDIIVEEAPEEEVADEIFTIVEEQADFPGGIGAFYAYVKRKFKYPPQARRMGLEGKVFVQFVVERDGSITDVRIIRGLGAGCDEEAVRVIKSSPKWNPGRQRGVPVRVRRVLPITFRLN